jgi:hypothetical protein
MVDRMQSPKRPAAFAFLAAILFSVADAGAQTATNLAALEGLAPVSALQNTAAGKAALAANLAATGAIQGGTARQPALLPFPAQQQQALRDAFITGGNARELADGLGSTLGAIYQDRVGYTSADDGQASSFTNISPAIALLIAYANATTRADSDSGKYFFANATLDNKEPVSATALAILQKLDGTTDIFGKAYGRPAGSAGANLYAIRGPSRPSRTF